MTQEIDGDTFRALADAGDLDRFQVALASARPDLGCVAEWWQGEFHVDLVFAPPDRSGDTLVVAAN